MNPLLLHQKNLTYCFINDLFYLSLHYIKVYFVKLNQQI
jgi:hypothetical protein